MSSDCHAGPGPDAAPPNPLLQLLWNHLFRPQSRRASRTTSGHQSAAPPKRAASANCNRDSCRGAKASVLSANGRLGRLQAGGRRISSTGLQPNSDSIRGRASAVAVLKNAVFAAFPQFCAFGRYVDRTLGELGAERILACAHCDKLRGHEWSGEASNAACDRFSLDAELSLPSGERSKGPRAVAKWSPRDVKFEPTQELAATVQQDLSRLSNEPVVPFTITDRRHLHPVVVVAAAAAADQPHTVCLDLKLIGDPAQVAHQASNLRPGDHVAVYPTNKVETVDAILERMTQDQRLGGKAPLDPDQAFRIMVSDWKRAELLASSLAATHEGAPMEVDPLEGPQWVACSHLPPVVSIREALARYLDITSPPSQDLLAILACQATDQNESKQLERMSSCNFNVHALWEARNAPNLLSVLRQFGSIKFNPALLTQLPKLNPRLYSLSGHLSATSLTVGVVRFGSAGGEEREGLCSSFLNCLPVRPGNRVYGCLRSAPGFHLPQDRTLPLLLISAGTGIAPFRSFWQQRFIEMSRASADDLSSDTAPVSTVGLSSFGRIDVYFECWNSSYLLYEDEMGEMLDRGVLSSLNIAFSRPPEEDLATKNAPVGQKQVKMFVQAKLIENGAHIYQQIMHNGAHVFVCGDAAMAEGVYKALTGIVDDGLKRQATRFLAIDGESTLMGLRNTSRYHEDIHL